MTSRIQSLKVRLGVVAMAATSLASITALSGAPAGAVSEVVSGKFHTQVVFGGACDAPAGICATGTTTGNLKGAFTLRVSEVVPTADTPKTGVLLFAGDGTVETKDGTLECKNAGALQTTGAGRLMSLCVVTGTGSGRWAGASGYLQVDGTVDLAAQRASGTYTGHIDAL